jgi:CheY-like chemotaxis protein/HPt (histidine-containing phosphotransfer) domain-containing protein
MSEQTVNRLFQPFMQADASTTRQYGGTGLGLAISHQLATLMGGSLSVRSIPGQGSIFTLTVWLIAPLSAAPPPILAHDLRGMRVLIVDDTPSSRALLLHLMHTWGIEVTAIASAAEALAVLHDAVDRGQPYDLALIDIVMPTHDGFALTRMIRAEPRLAGCAPILMTAYTQRSYSAAARAVGVAAFLTKPIRQSQLFDALVTALSGDTTQFEAEQSMATTGSSQPEPLRPEAGRILVVEDNQVNQKVAARLLEKLGYQVDVAANGREALAALDHIPYRLVLMDCHMPEMDGFTATAAIREYEGSDRHTPIIALTANALAGERERCLAAGMDDYLAKPIQKSLLEAKLAHWLDSTHTRAAAPVAPTMPEGVLDHDIIAQLRAMQDDGEEDLLVGLSAALDAEVEGGMRAFREALAQNMSPALIEIGHRLKGGCTALGALAFAQLWAEVERHGRAGDSAAAGMLLHSIEVEWVRVRSAFDALARLPHAEPGSSDL